MKKIRLILGMLAFVLAIGGTIASSTFKAETQVWEYLDGECIEANVPCAGGQYPCRLTPGGPVYRTSNSPVTLCGPEMFQELF
ncbi:MAG: DUF6520 family protein [Bacteroidota bacterium]